MTPNHPDLWRAALPDLSAAAHKYDRGYALVMGGDVKTGAARMAARAALRTGAGLVSIVCSAASFPIYASACEAIMVNPEDKYLSSVLSDTRITAVLHGPGAGTGKDTRDTALHLLEYGPATVLDADALTVFAEHREDLSAAIYGAKGPVVLTPHEGEFARLADHGDDTKDCATIAAAHEYGAVFVHKGKTTVIAAPDGRCAMQSDAPACLATAGTGDVLAGMITGLIAQGMPAYEAACAAVWLHARAAEAFPYPRGLIAEDLPDLIPQAFTNV